MTSTTAPSTPTPAAALLTALRLLGDGAYLDQEDYGVIAHPVDFQPTEALGCTHLLITWEPVTPAPRSEGAHSCGRTGLRVVDGPGADDAQVASGRLP